MSESTMPESIIVPTIDWNYDLTYLTPLQQWMLPYEPWWELCLWCLFGAMLIWQGYENLIVPYLDGPQKR